MIANIMLAVEETNIAFDESGVETQLRLVHYYGDDSYSEPSSGVQRFYDALSDLTETSDGDLDDVHQKRVDVGADIVAMIIHDDSSICGVAHMGPTYAKMFSITKWSCATGYFSFGHEIGHNMGCHHDRRTSGACGSNDGLYQFGWRDPQSQFHSILGYNCNSNLCSNEVGGSCTRVRRFSNPNYNYNGKPIGDADNDNARRINEVKGTIAAYTTAIVSSQCQRDAECEDNNPCTEGSCDEATGQCSYASICAPTPSPSQTPSSVPTHFACLENEILFQFELWTDYYPSESEWTLVNTCLNTNIALGGPYGEVSTEYIEKTCLPDAEYEFTILDSFGDGICCSYGNGKYSIYYDGNEVKNGGSFGAYESTTFGSC